MPSRPGPSDYTVSQFAAILARQPRHPQRTHMVDWFLSQTTRGSGDYTRQKPNHSARTTYQRLRDPAAILWIGAALGAPPSRIQAATAAARAEPDRRLHPGIIRRHLPWDLIATLAADQQQRTPPRWGASRTRR